MTKDEMIMKEALALAAKAAARGEVPVGAIVVRGDELIATAFNDRENGQDATAHAEILAIRSACKRLGRWRLEDCELYVTLEPCPMCAGAIVNARIARVVYGAKDANGGAFDSVLNLRSYPLCSKPSVEGGVLERECAAMLSGFFEGKRKNRKKF
ncbi:MAG: tRNA adenosine(34) deaminase TadA [Clostridia bacterium]|nr:tRNA adenosine(34) deaminase TadA [Clostridia bacterium]